HPLAFVRASERSADKPPVLQPRDSAIGSGPQVPVAVFPNRANVVVRKPVLHCVAPQLARGTPRQQPEAATHPEIAPAVLQKSDDDIAYRPQHRNEPA